MTTAKETKSRIPEFKSIEEEAEFWDTHDTTEFEDEFEEVEVKFARPLLKRGLTIRLEEETIEELRRLGKEKGVGPTTLARMWILEKLEEVETKSTPIQN